MFIKENDVQYGKRLGNDSSAIPDSIQYHLFSYQSNKSKCNGVESEGAETVPIGDASN